MAEATALRDRMRPAGRPLFGVLLVVLFTFVAWSARVAFGHDALSDLTLSGLANEALRAVIFVGPVLLYCGTWRRCGRRSSFTSSRRPGTP